MNKYIKLLILTILVTTIFMLTSTSALATTWEYKIKSSDTPSTINENKTNAVIDTGNNEIRLPRFAPNSAAFWPDSSSDYVTITPDGVKHFSWTGTDMAENDVLSVPEEDNPVAVAAPKPYPDVVVLDKDEGSKHYSFTGNAMVENPVLSAAGMSGTMFMGARDKTVAGIFGEEIRAFNEGLRDTTLEPGVSLNNPIGLSLYPEQNNMAVLQPGKARFFMDTGSGMVENPALNITGLNNPKAIATGEGLETAIIDGNKVKHYSFDGNSLAYNSTLSITSGLTEPKSIAINPGNKDKIVIDGNEVKYYSFNPSTGEMEYNSSKSTTLSNMEQLGGYAPSADVISDIKDPGVDATFLRARAYTEVPEGTSITWYLSNNGGSTYVKSWRIINNSGTPEYQLYENGTWNSMEIAADPGHDNQNLWKEITPGNRDIVWKAVLKTNDYEKTPKISVPESDDKAIIWTAGNPPDEPDIEMPDACFPTTTPVIDWTFSDPDPGSSQSAFEVIISKESDGTKIHETGIINSTDSEYEIPTSNSPDSPSILWDSGEYEYDIKIRTYDNQGIPSEWSNNESFCVIGLERPRVSKLASPGGSQTAPDPSQPSTHIVIPEGMTEDKLPLTKAGAEVQLLVDSIGPLNSLDAKFPYLSKNATVDKVENNNMLDSSTNRWVIEFYTEASLEEVPSGTVVEMNLEGQSPEGDTIISTTKDPPYAAGIVKTMGSVYEDWFTTLRGREN